MNTLESLAAISASSQQLVNLSSAFLGGSVLLVFGTTHISPPNTKVRSMYFLLIISWAFLLLSMFSGDSVLRHYLAATVAKTDQVLMGIFSLANGSYDDQLNYLRLAVLFFAIWLFFYMVWWIAFRAAENRSGTQ
ncbi:hypothetical protein EI969_17550 [Pseudomonas sp. PB101]|uniref:hypothetical protein n=1 Tax=Pseudomonas sp. PB101 TaxID=2495428 RepID=UPI00136658C7|nr:hypothetical protein [Pseudomonas sp. PB101]MVW87725.1 hypothetical protein [Pseudomonas sp. PB101]